MTSISSRAVSDANRREKCKLLAFDNKNLCSGYKVGKILKNKQEGKNIFFLLPPHIPYHIPGTQEEQESSRNGLKLGTGGSSLYS
jgi:hypothetical protein